MASIVKYRQDGVSLTINDYLDIVVKVPQITQLFAKAAVQFATSLVVGSVAQIVVTIGEELNKVEYIRHEQTVVLKIAKLDATTTHYARAVQNAEQAGFPEAMKQEYKDALYRQFYHEMQKLAPN